MDFRILGPFEVLRDDAPVELPRGRGRALLALLILQAGEVVAADRLLDELWGPTPPPTAVKSLHNLISGLRKRLGAPSSHAAEQGVLATWGSGYLLRIGPDQVDANRFRLLVRQAAGAPAVERAASLRAALGLWRGPALADFTYVPFAQREIAVLDELRLTATEERIDADIELGRHAELIGELEGLVADQPFRERLRAQLMLALYRCGRQADALAVYQAGRRVLVDELGIDPGPALRDLEQAILRQDPSLGHPRVSLGTSRAAASTMADHWLSAARKTVTFVNAEVDAPATTTDVADPEAVRSVQASSIATATGILERHGGTVQGTIGGVIVAVFGVPAAREDDALRAVRAAVELRDAVASRHVGQGRHGSAAGVARVGISTGEVVVGDDATGPAATGDAVRLAARLQQAAADGEVLVGEATRRLLGDTARVESVPPAGVDRGRAVAAWRVTALADGADGRAPARTNPLVGRAAELARLRAALEQARRRGRATRFTVVGEPGVGKSRLALEFAQALPAGTRALSCRCPFPGEGSTFWPLRELVARAVGGSGEAGIADLLAGQPDAAAVAAAVAAAIGTGPGSTESADAGAGTFGGATHAGKAGHCSGADQSTRDTKPFPAIRRLFEALADDCALAVIVDDAHWAAGTFLDLIDYLAEWAQAPLLIVCLARPELRGKRPRWFADKGEAASLVLAPLSPADSETLVAYGLAGRLVPDEVAAQIVGMAQGNPLYIEQLLAALREEGKIAFPPSVHALLAARLDRLGPAERDLLRCASVIGTEFSVDALMALVPDEAKAFVDRHLGALQRTEFLRPAASGGAGQRDLGFRHVLIQQAAYRSVTRAARADLHERLAAWFEQHDARAPDEVIAFHLEQAVDQRRRLGLEDEATQELAVNAGERLAQCGLHAYQRFDMAAAENLLGRARGLLPAGHPLRDEVLRRLSQAYPTLGRLADAEETVEEILTDPRFGDDPARARRLRLQQLRIRLIAGPDPVRHDTIRREVEEAVVVLEALGDHVGLAQACYLLGTMHVREGRIRDLEEIARRGLEHARRSGDVREVIGSLWWPSWALVLGPTPVSDAVTACEELLAVGPGEHVAVLTDLARLEAMRGGFDRARGLAGAARREVVEHARVRRALTVLAHRRAEVEILAGDLDAAESVLRPAVEIALDVGERDQTAQLAAELSRVLAARGATQEAATLAALSRREAPAESVAAQALWRAATARAQAGDGQSAGATGLAREALALVPTDLLNLRAELMCDLAAVLDAAGNREEACALLDEATDLYTRKGNLVGAAKAQGLLDGR